MESDASRFAVPELIAQAGWVRALALHLVGNEAEAEDLAQETLTAALEHEPGTDRGLRPWLARVMRTRRAFFARSRAARRHREEQSSRGEGLPSSAELAARAEIQRRLVDEVLKLEDPYRSLVVLRFYEGLSPVEIARRLDRPAGSVRGQLSRAMDLLRRALDASEREGELDWRSAVLPLTAGIRTATPPGSWVTSALTTTLLAMHVVTKSILVALICLGLLSVVWLSSLWLSGGPEADVPSEQQIAGRFDLPRAPAPGEDPVVEVAAAALPVPAERGAPRREAAAAPAEPEAGQPIRGLLLNWEAAGAGRPHPPLGDFLLDLMRGEELLETLLTDLDGRFETERSYTTGTYTLMLREHDWSDPHVHLLRLGMPVRPVATPSTTVIWTEGQDLVIEVGTRLVLPLEFVGPEHVAERLESVLLVSMAREDVVGSAHPRAERASIHRDAGGAWARFHDNGLDGLERWYVRAESKDGLWVAETGIAARGGHHQEPVRLLLESAGRIDVTIPCPPGVDSSSVVVLVEAPGSEGARFPAVAEEGDGFARRFHLGALGRGRHLLVCYAEGTEVVKEHADVRCGEVTELSVELDWPYELYPVSLKLSSETGEFCDLASFGALPVAAEGKARRYADGMVEWFQGEDGRWSGTQSLGMMPAGEYRLVLMGSFSFHPWDHEGRTFSVPGPSFELTCLDGGPTRSYGLRVVDQLSGAELEAKAVALELSVNGLPGPICFPEGALYRLPDVPTDSEVHWRLSAEGYEPCAGDLSEAILEGELWIVEAELTRAP